MMEGLLLNQFEGSRTKIGIMGGTFDPIHLAHLLAAERAREAFGLDAVWFVPSSIAPHKQHEAYASDAHRLEMVKLATKPYRTFKVKDDEIKRGGKSYSIDTIQLFQEKHPDVQFYFIIGADMVEYLPKWHRIEQLAKLVTFIGVERSGHVVEVEPIASEIGAKVLKVEMPTMAISSSQIRERYQNRLSIRFLVPDCVYTYIKEHRLYEMED